jgi:hypothetical protein
VSTNSECAFIEIKPRRWFYLLEDYDAPKNAWDWREHSRAYGPFTTIEEAQQHLRDNHANPGGSSVTHNDQYKPNEVVANKVDEATK